MNRPCCRSIVLLAAVLGGTADGQRSVAGRAAGPAERGVACAPDPLVPGVEFTRITVDTGEIVIARVTRAVVAPDDGLWVLDGTGPVIVKLDSTGRLERAITARGEGPGELSQPEAMAVRPDG